MPVLASVLVLPFRKLCRCARTHWGREVGTAAAEPSRSHACPATRQLAEQLTLLAQPCGPCDMRVTRCDPVQH